MKDFKNKRVLPREALEELFQKTLIIWNNLELNNNGDPEWPNLRGTKLHKTCQISFCSSVLYTHGVELEDYFGYLPVDAGFYRPTEQRTSTEIMFVDFMLMYLADELGYEFVEFTEAASSFGEETKNV